MSVLPLGSAYFTVWAVVGEVAFEGKMAWLCLRKYSGPGAGPRKAVTSEQPLLTGQVRGLMVSGPSGASSSQTACRVSCVAKGDFAVFK